LVARWPFEHFAVTFAAALRRVNLLWSRRQHKKERLKEFIKMQDALDRCRLKFGSAPRRFGWYQRWFYLYGSFPKWLEHDKDLMGFVRAQDDLLKNGMVVWGALIQANQLLFSPGDESHPGEVLYCTNPLAKVNVSELQYIAHSLFELKGTKPENPALLPIADYLTDELIRVFGMEVPTFMSPMMDCAISTVLFMRSHLPNQMLSRGLFPIIVSPQAPRYAMVLPAKYWPDDLTAWWNGNR
jgi:hypothetical protein